VKAIVIEDSRLAREGLIRMLEQFDDIEIVGAAEHPGTAFELIKIHQPSVLFLDIHMPGESGFDLLDKLDYIPQVIFTTAYSEYAYRSFDYNPVDYLLKPISPERLSSAIDKTFALDNKIFIKDGDDYHLVALKNIRYFESCKNYSRVFFSDQKTFIKKALSSIESRLPANHFFRANRQFIVNLNHIEAMQEGLSEGVELEMKDGMKIEVSRRNASELKKLLSF